MRKNESRNKKGGERVTGPKEKHGPSQRKKTARNGSKGPKKYFILFIKMNIAKFFSYLTIENLPVDANVAVNSNNEFTFETTASLNSSDIKVTYTVGYQ